MGVGKHYDLHETADTRAASRDEGFEEILRKVKEAGGKINKDETTPLYTEVGMQEFEVGSKRIVEMPLGRNEFQLTRKVETEVLQGAGHQKHLEKLTPPRITVSMKRRPDTEDTWQTVDVDELF